MSSEPSAPESPAHKEEDVEGLPPLPAQGEKPAVPTSPAATGISRTIEFSGSGRGCPGYSTVDRHSVDGRQSQSRLLAQDSNPDPTQKPVTPSGPDAIESRDVSSLPPAIETPVPTPSQSDVFIPNRSTPPSTLRPILKREVEMIVRKQEDDLRRKPQTQPTAPARDTIVSDLRAQTQLDISRAPSPAEARTIKAIPVPEDWVPLPPRTWSPQRKYWAAAATCHLPLYFQDPVLERYGHSVEQFVGPIGRFLTYPVDDPTQSIQRNQIIQPFFSAGLFALQIAALPYNVIMDPPWEAQYDLGYYRPGDLIPTDTYWLPLHGYGPPLRGSSY